MGKRTNQKAILPALLVLGALAWMTLGTARTASAEPSAQAASSEGVGLLPGRDTDKATTRFGFSGPRPLDATSPTGIVRPSPAPILSTSAFGFTKPQPAVRFRTGTGIVCTTPAPVCRDGTCGQLCGTTFGSGVEDVVEIERVRKPARSRRNGRTTRVIRISTQVVRPSCDPCRSVCDPYGSVCDPCAPCGTTTCRDKMSVPTAFWSSGYHDGCDDLGGPCTTTCSPCTTSCAPRVTPCRVVRRCVTPCVSTCGPRWGGCGPCFRPALRVGFGFPCGGWGWGCGPGWGGWGGCW